MNIRQASEIVVRTFTKPEQAIEPTWLTLVDDIDIEALEPGNVVKVCYEHALVIMEVTSVAWSNHAGALYVSGDVLAWVGSFVPRSYLTTHWTNVNYRLNPVHRSRFMRAYKRAGQVQ